MWLRKSLEILLSSLLKLLVLLELTLLLTRLKLALLPLPELPAHGAYVQTCHSLRGQRPGRLQATRPLVVLYGLAGLLVPSSIDLAGIKAALAKRRFYLSHGCGTRPQSRASARCLLLSPLLLVLPTLPELLTLLCALYSGSHLLVTGLLLTDLALLRWLLLKILLPRLPELLSGLKLLLRLLSTGHLLIASGLLLTELSLLRELLLKTLRTSRALLLLSLLTLLLSRWTQLRKRLLCLLVLLLKSLLR